MPHFTFGAEGFGRAGESLADTLRESVQNLQPRATALLTEAKEQGLPALQNAANSVVAGARTAATWAAIGSILAGLAFLAIIVFVIYYIWYHHQIYRAGSGLLAKLPGMNLSQIAPNLASITATTPMVAA